MLNATYGHEKLTCTAFGKNEVYPVYYVLSAGIKSWFAESTVPFTPSLAEFPSHHTALLRQAITEQEQIGLHNAVLGYRLSTTWQTAASFHTYLAGDQDQSCGNSRVLQFLKSLYDLTRSFWLSCNAMLHNTKDVLAQEIQSTEAAEICPNPIYCLPAINTTATVHLSNYCAALRLYGDAGFGIFIALVHHPNSMMVFCKQTSRTISIL